MKRTAAAVLLVLATGCGATAGYDEAAHREAVTAYNQGRPVDWEMYQSGKGTCDFDDLAMHAAVAVDETGKIGLIVLDVHYQCPERMGELAGVLGDLSL